MTRADQLRDRNIERIADSLESIAASLKAKGKAEEFATDIAALGRVLGRSLPTNLENAQAIITMAVAQMAEAIERLDSR